MPLVIHILTLAFNVIVVNVVNLIENRFELLPSEITLFARDFAYVVQGDNYTCSNLLLTSKHKFRFGLARAGQAKAELLV